MDIKGGCHCGFLTYEAEVDPEKAMICHCTDCQHLSGTVFRTILPVTDSRFRLLTGTPKIYVKTAESGNPREQAFCPHCGTHLYAAPPPPGPRALNLRVGTIEQRDRLVPKLQLWSRSAQAWLEGLDGIPKVEKQSF